MPKKSAKGSRAESPRSATTASSAAKGENQKPPRAQTKAHLGGAEKLLREHLFDESWSPGPLEIRLALLCLSGLAIDLATDVAKEGLRLPQVPSPTAREFIESADGLVGLETTHPMYTTIVTGLKNHPPNAETKKLVATWLRRANAPVTREAELSELELEDSVLACINRSVAIRARVFFDNLGAPWDSENVVVRACRNSLPKIKVETQIDSDAALVQVISKLYAHQPEETISNWIEQVAKPKYSLDSMFSGPKGSGVNDPAALLQVNAVAADETATYWWSPAETNDARELSCWGLDYRRLCMIYDYYGTVILNPNDSSVAERATYQKRPMVPGANAVIFDSTGPVEGLLMQRRPQGEIGGNNRCRLSLFGGGYKAKFLASSHDAGSLSATLVREVIEEAGIVVSTPRRARFGYLEEVKKKSQMQFCTLGAYVTERFPGHDEARSQMGAPEGSVKVVTASELVELIRDKSWELSCHAFAALVLWLVAGAPSATPQFLNGLKSSGCGHWVGNAEWLDALDESLFVRQASIAKSSTEKKYAEYRERYNNIRSTAPLV